MIVFPLHCLRSSIVAPLPAWVIVKPCRWNMAAEAPATYHIIAYTLWRNESSSHIWNHVYMSARISTCVSGEITHLPMWLKCRACHLASLAISTHTQAPQSHHFSHLGHWGTHQGWVLAHVEWGSTLWVIARVGWHPGHIAQLLHGTSLFILCIFSFAFRLCPASLTNISATEATSDWFRVALLGVQWWCHIALHHL